MKSEDYISKTICAGVIRLLYTRRYIVDSFYFRNINTGTFSRCRAIVPSTVTQSNVRRNMNTKIRVK